MSQLDGDAPRATRTSACHCRGRSPLRRREGLPTSRSSCPKTSCSNCSRCSTWRCAPAAAIPLNKVHGFAPTGKKVEIRYGLLEGSSMARDPANWVMRRFHHVGRQRVEATATQFVRPLLGSLTCRVGGNAGGGGHLPLTPIEKCVAAPRRRRRRVLAAAPACGRARRRPPPPCRSASCQRTDGIHDALHGDRFRRSSSGSRDRGDGYSDRPPTVMPGSGACRLTRTVMRLLLMAARARSASRWRRNGLDRRRRC